MSATITLSCDRTRHRQPCRGALHTRTPALGPAIVEGERAGWTVDSVDSRPLFTCPSSGHDEESR